MIPIRFLALAAAFAVVAITGFGGLASAHDETKDPTNCAQVPVGYCYWCPETYSYPGHVHCTVRDYCVRVLVCVPGTFAGASIEAPRLAETVAAGSVLP